MTEKKVSAPAEAPHASRRSGSSDMYPPPSPNTLRAMESAELDLPADSGGSDMLAAMELDEPPPAISATKRNSQARSLEQTGTLTTPTRRLRTIVKTTPKASVAIQAASKRRAAQEAPIVGGVPSSPALEDAESINPSSSPGVVLAGAESHDDTTTASSSPTWAPQQLSHDTAFIFPSDDTPPYSQPSGYNTDLWEQMFPQDQSGGGGNLSSGPWVPEPPGLPSRPPRPRYSTKPSSEPHVHSHRYTSEEPQSAGYPFGPAYPMHGPPSYYHHQQPMPRAPAYPSYYHNNSSLPPLSLPQPGFASDSLFFPPSHNAPPSPAFAPMHLQVTPPTPLDSGRQQATHSELRVRSPLQAKSPLPPTPTSIVVDTGSSKERETALEPARLSRAEKGKGREEATGADVEEALPDGSDVQPDGIEMLVGKAVQLGGQMIQQAGEVQQAAVEGRTDSILARSDDLAIDSPPSSVPGSPSSDRGAASGRWKNATLDGANDVYRETDASLRAFCELHHVSFKRVLAGYLKRHNLKLPGDNRWNTYTMLHRHIDHKKRELGRIGLSIEEFDALNGKSQQKKRAKCWKLFQESFETPQQCNFALELFTELTGVEEKLKGTTVGKRQKVFSALINSLARHAEVACNLNNFQYWMAVSGSHLHSDHALVEVRMSDGMKGFTDNICHASTDKMKGHMLAWSFKNTSDNILQHDWPEDVTIKAGPSTLPAPQAGPSADLKALKTAAASDSSESSGSSPETSMADLPLTDKNAPAKARHLLRGVLVEAGGDLGDSTSALWRKLPPFLAGNRLQVFNWPADCPLPPLGNKGIESAGKPGLRAFVLQFSDPKFPIRVRRVDDPVLQQALLNSELPVIYTTTYGTPLSRRSLLANGTILDQLVGAVSGKKSSVAAALEDLPSSELTPLEDSDTPSSSTPSPVKSKGKSKSNVAAPAKRKIHVISPGESEAESPPKRIKAPSSSSGSSIEVGEVETQPLPKTPHTAQRSKAKKAPAKTRGTLTRSHAKAKKVAPKSQEYIEDSDDNMEGIIEEGEGRDEKQEKIVADVPARPKPRPRARQAAASSSVQPPAPPIVDTVSPEASRGAPALSKPPTLQKDHEALTKPKFPPPNPYIPSPGTASLAPRTPMPADEQSRALPAHAAPFPAAPPPPPPPTTTQTLSHDPTSARPAASSRSTTSSRAARSRHGEFADARSPASSRESADSPSLASIHGYPSAPSTASDPRRSPHPEYEGAYGVEGGYRDAQGYGRMEGRYDDRFMSDRERYGYSGMAPGPPGYPPAPNRGYIDPFNHRFQPSFYPPPSCGAPYPDYHPYGGEAHHSRYPQTQPPPSFYSPPPPPPPSPYADYRAPHYQSIPAQPQHTRRRPQDPAAPGPPSRAISPEEGPSQVEGR
ncbi:hypothetical protein HWV62_34405 [Athelia sp. TMB]|nr:hypothetical protein HWV62_34405 [Athelia sp. TMB]